MSVRDYYELLEVDRSAGPDEIKRSYRRLARRWHPDANPDDPEAESRFKEISLAYETLSDPQRRQRYDMFGPEGAAASAGGDPFGGAGFGGLFDSLFGEAFFGGGRPSGCSRSARRCCSRSLRSMGAAS